MNHQLHYPTAWNEKVRDDGTMESSKLLHVGVIRETYLLALANAFHPKQQYSVIPPTLKNGLLEDILLI